MVDRTSYSRTQLRVSQTLGVILVVLGMWHALHGGLSLLGGFGLERHIARERGEPVRSALEMGVELGIGAAVLVCGLALYFIIKLSSGLDVMPPADPSKMPPLRRAVNRLNAIAILGACVWIGYVVFEIAAS